MNNNKKRTRNSILYLLLWISMYSGILIGNFAYHGGFSTHIAIAALVVVLAYVGFAFTRRIWDIVFLYANLIGSVYFSSVLATQNYCDNVSTDAMSRVIGNTFTKITLVITLLAIILF